MAAPAIAAVAKKLAQKYAEKKLKEVKSNAAKKATDGKTTKYAILAVGALLILITIAPLVLFVGVGNAAASRPALAKKPVDFVAVFGPVGAAYVNASEMIETMIPGCAMRPQILAGIAQEESHQGTLYGRTVDPVTLNVVPPIYGPVLNGTLEGTRVVVDTDGGALDLIVGYDRAMGPFQFMPESWMRYGRDGDGDGLANPQNMWDAALSAAVHLCSQPGPPANLNENDAALRAAIMGYNNSTVYLTAVLGHIEAYDELAIGGGVVDGYSLPVPKDAVSLEMLGRPHWNSTAAIDIGLPVGTPAFAITDGVLAIATPDDGSLCGGTIVLSGNDGANYVYCHLSVVSVSAGSAVVAGQPLGLTGGQPGALGSGSSKGPHLHMSMTAGGSVRCIQGVLQGIFVGSPIRPETAVTSGCHQ